MKFMTESCRIQQWKMQTGVDFVKKAQADVIAIGGGSPIDTAKAIGIIVENPEFSDVVSLEAK